jgi:hypothetical protein
MSDTKLPHSVIHAENYVQPDNSSNGAKDKKKVRFWKMAFDATTLLISQRIQWMIRISISSDVLGCERYSRRAYFAVETRQCSARWSYYSFAPLLLFEGGRQTLLR